MTEGIQTQMLLNQHLTDINPILAGYTTKHHFRNSFTTYRTHVFLKYISHGYGTLTVDGTVYPIKAGQCLLLMPWHNNAYLDAAEDSYLNYTWVGFTGTMSHDFSALPPVFDLPEGLMPHLKNLTKIDSSTALDLASDLLLLRSRMIPPREQATDYVQYVMDYVNQSYMHKLSVESIAELMSLDRSYLSRLFKKKVGQSLQEYILNVRLLQAKRFLMENKSVKETAALCGFRDPYIFSKLFSQKTDFSPSEWKKIALYNLSTLQNTFPAARMAKTGKEE